jgi:hypothetical protein
MLQTDGGEHRHASPLRCDRQHVADAEQHRAAECEREPDQRTGFETKAAELGGEHRRHAGDAERAAGDHPLFDAIGENQAAEHDVPDGREREHDRQQPGRDVLRSVIEQHEIDGEDRRAESGEIRLLGKREDRALAAPGGEGKHQRRGNRKAPDHRHFRRDGAHLVMQCDPGQAPGEHGRRIKPVIERRQCGARPC